MLWMKLRLLVALALSLSVWSADAALVSIPIWILPALALVFVIFQLGVSLLGDIATLRRARWNKPSLHTKPWQSGLPVASPFFIIITLFTGIMLIISSIFMGSERIVTGVSFIVASAILYGGQILICKLFASRFPR